MRNHRFESLERQELLSSVPVVADPTTTNAAYVEAVYQDALGRQADPVGLNWGVVQLNLGQQRLPFTMQVVSSDEAYADFIGSVYQQYLGRGADAAGMNYWLEQMQAGARKEAIEAAVLASDEFYTRAGGTQADWIEAAYQAVFGRLADPGGFGWATAVLDSGTARSALALALTMSQEHEAKTVEQDLSRLAFPTDPATVSTLASRLGTGQITEQELVAYYLATPEYFELHTGVPPTIVPVPNLPAQGVAANIASQATQGNVNVAFVGDSITQFWTTTGSTEWNQYFAPLGSLDAGVEGDTTQSVLFRLEQGNLQGISPKLVVLMIGVNNVSEGDPPSDIATGITSVVRTLESEFPAARILLLGDLPGLQVAADSPQRQELTQINQMIRPLADGQRVWFLDVGSQFVNSDGSLNGNLYDPDNLHPSAQGYQVLAQAISPWVDVLSS